MAKKDAMMKDPLAVTAFVLVVVGALNWGLVGLLGINLVNYLIGSWPTLEKIVYILVGLAGLYKLYWAWGQSK